MEPVLDTTSRVKDVRSGRTAVAGSSVRGAATLGLIAVNTLVAAIPFYVVALAKLVPGRRWRDGCSRALVGIAHLWVRGNDGILRATRSLEWDVAGVKRLDRDASYLIACNHQSWADILILQSVFAGRVPFLRFFLKRELLWFPVLGFCWWALDFPFVRRTSREQLRRRPELRLADFESTRRACEKLRHRPVTILNFLEGTRFTAEKHGRQQSPYRHLLRPKAGGAAFVLGLMGDHLKSVLDVTIAYPEGRPSFWEFLSGRVRRIIVRVQEVPIPAEFVRREYLTDETFRARFQEWTQELWARKDDQLTELLSA